MRLDGQLQRIKQLDTVRGIAILGILLLNIYAFALPLSAYMNPLYSPTVSNSDHLVWSLLNIFAQGKFLAIFALLFGATLAILMHKDRRWHKSRLLILALIGLIHGIGFWDGDILLPYAITGILAYGILARYPKLSLIKTSVVIYLIGLIILFIIGFNINADGYWVMSEVQIQQEVAQKVAGGIEGAFLRFSAILGTLEMLIIQYGWQLLALMLIGAKLMRNGWLAGEFSSQHYRNIAKLFIPIAILIQLASLYYQRQEEWRFFSTSIVGYIINELVIPFQSIGYTALIYAYWGNIKDTWLCRRLADIGRMALTNYLLQTLICTTIFYHLHYFAQFNRLELLLFIVPIWCVNLAFSYFWLNYFSQGPIEWLWRKSTMSINRFLS